MVLLGYRPRMGIWCKCIVTGIGLSGSAWFRPRELMLRDTKETVSTACLTVCSSFTNVEIQNIGGDYSIQTRMETSI